MAVSKTIRFLMPLALAAAPAIADAQAAATAPAAQFGPAVAGLCFFSREGALGGSKAGQAANARLKQLGAQIESELGPQQQAIVTENNAINAGATTIPAAQRQARMTALQQRAQSFQQLQQTRSAQMQATRDRALGQILTTVTTVVAPIANSRHCSVVFDSNSTFGYNPAMDLTRDVVAQLDARLPSVSFDLATPESLRQQQR